jgi:hypothetical protein
MEKNVGTLALEIKRRIEAAQMRVLRGMKGVTLRNSRMRIKEIYLRIRKWQTTLRNTRSGDVMLTGASLQITKKSFNYRPLRRPGMT